MDAAFNEFSQDAPPVCLALFGLLARGLLFPFGGISEIQAKFSIYKDETHEWLSL